MRAVLLLPLALLAACGDGLDDAEERAKEEADVAYVEGLEAKDPAPEPIEPQVIGYPDIERYQIYGANCAFAPGDSLGAVLIAEEDKAWLKLGERMIRLASDPGSSKRPFGTWSNYDGKEYAAKLQLDPEAGEQVGDEVVDYRGSLIIEDAYGQRVYSAEGLFQCGA